MAIHLTTLNAIGAASDMLEGLRMSEDTIKEARKLYGEYPELAFSFLIDVVEAQNKTLAHLIQWSQHSLGDQGVKDLMEMLNNE